MDASAVYMDYIRPSNTIPQSILSFKRTPIAVDMAKHTPHPQTTAHYYTQLARTYPVYLGLAATASRLQFQYK